MKTKAKKSIKDEIGFIVLATFTVIALSVIIFPLFIILLPIIIIEGCKEIWYLDHMNKNSRSGS